MNKALPWSHLAPSNIYYKNDKKSVYLFFNIKIQSCPLAVRQKASV